MAEGKKYCVYSHINPIKGEIFYIGIGVKSRPFDPHKRSKLWKNVVNKYGIIVNVIQDGLDWIKACEIEKELIKLYGRRDLGLGTLVNMTDGGDGIAGYKMSDQSKYKMRIAKIGKKQSKESVLIRTSKLIGRKRSNEIRDKISLKHKGTHKTEDHKIKISEKLKGRKVSPEALKNMKEARAKMNTEEYRNKQSEIMFKIWEKRK